MQLKNIFTALRFPTFLLILLMGFMCWAGTVSCAAAPLTIASQGKSTYSIVTPEIPPVSVKKAAAEMQRSIAESTGAKLPIVKDDETVSGSIISLGSTKQAQAAGLSAEAIAEDGFRIVTKGGNLYIIGLDTTTENLRPDREDVLGEVKLHPEIPGPAYTRGGGFSHGTANGVYTFLEDQLGVRWLFEGDLGRVVPAKSTFAVEAMDRTEVPKFNFRVLGLVRGNLNWSDRQKLGYSNRISFAHNFSETVPADLFEKHPDWFPMINGARRKPSGHNYKLETTNPELVRYFADKAIAAMKADPKITTYSLSPSDARGWSESPESKALYDPAPREGGYPSMTPLVLKFYRDVAAIVAKEYPQGRVGGYLYQDFSYPPQQGSMELPENFIPVIVGKSMGYTFYRPSTRELEAKLLQEWSKVAPENWYYYGMPTWLREGSAKVTPAAPEQLNFLYHNMVEAGIKGAFIYGTFVQSQGALVNYVNAKMLWNPTGDAKAVQRDWLMNAYGPKAGAVMEQLYNKLDESWWADFFRSPQSTHYNVSEVMFRNTYGAHFPEMEKLFLEAEAQPMTEKQKQRLDLIKVNMIALEFRLRNAGYLPAGFKSRLARTPEEVFALFTDKETKDHFSYVLVPSSGGAIRPVKVQVGQLPAAPPKELPIPNANHVLLYSARDGEVRLKPSKVSPGASFLTYYVQDAAGKTVTRGFLSQGHDITFKAKANQPYYFRTVAQGVTLQPQVRWEMSVPGAVPAAARFQDDLLYLQNAKAGTAAAETAPLYVYVPSGSGLEMDGDAADVTVKTETDETASSRAHWELTKAAAAALTAAQKRYDANLVQNLDHRWKFSPDPQKTGEQNRYFKPDFDDSAWKTIYTIGPWQHHGFRDYHGTGWYRKTITLADHETDPLAMGNNSLLLFFGAIDGDAEIYMNGVKIAERVMAQHSNGWEQPVAYDVSGAVHIGKNTIAVKVTKNQFAAGLYRGVSLLAGVLPKKE